MFWYLDIDKASQYGLVPYWVYDPENNAAVQLITVSAVQAYNSMIIGVTFKPLGITSAVYVENSLEING